MIDPASISTDPTTMPSKPLWAETKARVYGSWFAVVGFDLGKWTLGFAFDVAPTGFYIDLGPLFAGAERDEAPPKSYDHLPDWSWSLLRFVIQKWKIELRLELDLNIWRLGYIMADMHDHGLYVGPFNLQIEYNKLYAYPDLTLATVQHAFFEWLDTARLRLKIPMELRALTGRQIELAFVGINSAIGATLTTRELSVFVEWEGRIWDFFRCFDVWPRLAIGGYICEHCRPEQRTIFPCMQALSRCSNGSMENSRRRMQSAFMARLHPAGPTQNCYPTAILKDPSQTFDFRCVCSGSKTSSDTRSVKHVGAERSSC
jgi:hypothetical protein